MIFCHFHGTGGWYFIWTNGYFQFFRSPTGPQRNAENSLALFKYQLVSVFCLAVLLPAMTIGSSVHLRRDVEKIRNKVNETFDKLSAAADPHQDQNRDRIYALTTSNNISLGNQVSWLNLFMLDFLLKWFYIRFPYFL